MIILCGALLAAGCASVRERTDAVREKYGRGGTKNETEQEQDQAIEQDPEASETEAEEVPDESVSEPETELPDPSDEADAQPEEEPKEPLAKYDEILTVNPYVAGWLTIDDSVIDDPVVYTPKSQNYFLHRDIDGSNASKGTLFIAVDWQEGYHNTLIYGHNMKDGSGFGSLAKFADESYGMSHPVLHFDTLYEEQDYQLLAAFYSQIDEEELETEEDRKEADEAIKQETIEKKEEAGEIVPAEPGETAPPVELTLFDIDLTQDFGGVDLYRQEKDEDAGRFRYYYYTDLADRGDFDYYVQNVKERALYDTGVDAEWGDDLITLSTCSYQVRNGRFVVVGVKKNR